MNENPLDKAVSCFKRGRAEMAEALGVTPMAISQWYRRGVPVNRAIDIEVATEGQVTRKELRPDIFGDLPESATA